MAPLAGNIAVVTRQPAAALGGAITELKKQHPLVTDVAVLASAAAATGSAFDGVIAFSESTDSLGADLETLAPIVKAGGALHVHVANASEDAKSSILMALMIGGFVEAAESDTKDGAAFFPTLANASCFSSKKPAFESGAALSLGKKTTTAGTTSALPLKKWTVLADDFDAGVDDDDEIIDEDTLLDDTDEVLQAAKNDCGPTAGGAKKRACKNCTCGLKDEEDKPVVSDKDLSQMVSSCGNCFKGDAFRCGSCPFLGKPAFKPGMEKVLLNLDDADDI